MRRGIRHALALAALLLLATAGPAPAQFGTQVRPGESDFVPVTTKASQLVKVNEADFGQPGVVTDNCLLLDTGSVAAAGAQFEDIRLTPCMGKPLGSLIADADVVETRAAYPNVAAANVQYMDANGNAKYDKGDGVYITTMPPPGLAASTATGTWTVRVTPVGNYTAGSFVFAGDADHVAARLLTTSLNRLQLARLDPKAWYLAPTGGTEAAPVALPQFSLLPQDSIRVAGAFGGKPDVKAEGFAFTPTTPVAGEAFQFSIDVKNFGKGTGTGLISTKMNGVVVDTRASPVLDPGAKATLVFDLAAPAGAGNVTMEVGEFKFLVPLAAPAKPRAVTEAEARAAALETRLATLERDTAAVKADLAAAQRQLAGAVGALSAMEAEEAARLTASAAEAPAEPLGARNVPGLEVALLLAALGAAALAAWRRA